MSVRSGSLLISVCIRDKTQEPLQGSADLFMFVVPHTQTGLSHLYKVVRRFYFER